MALFSPFLSGCQSYRWLPCNVAASALLKQTFADAEDLQYFSVESPYPTPWSNVCGALRLIPELQPLYYASYTTLLEILNGNGNGNGNSKSPVASLLNFYQQRIENFKTSAALGWNRSVVIAPELAKGGCITVDMFKNYVTYQMRQLGKFSLTCFRLSFSDLRFRNGEWSIDRNAFKIMSLREYEGGFVYTLYAIYKLWDVTVYFHYASCGFFHGLPK